jgi:hypothetical protein
MQAYFNHNISMRSFSVSITMTCESRARPGYSNALASWIAAFKLADAQPHFGVF